MSFDDWLYTIPLRLRTLFRRRRIESELDEELRDHLARRIEHEIAKGADPEEARYTALRAMEGLEQHKEECRDVRRLNVVENLARDLQYAARMLRKSPVFASVAILSLALAIGANTAVFSLIDALLLRPLPVPEPGRLVNIFANIGAAEPRYYFTYSIFEEIVQQNHVFSNVFTWAGHRFQMRSGADMVHVDGALASGDYFQALGVPPAIGRTFTIADDKSDGGKDGPVAVISDAFWSRQFQRNPSAIGSATTLDGVRFTIIGAMPQGFFGAQEGTRPDIWVPLWLTTRMDSPRCINSRSCWWLVTMARLKPGISEKEARADLKVISPHVMRNTLPPNWDAAEKKQYLKYTLSTTSGANGWTDLRTRFSNPLAVLMILVAVVLLIACANMANLLLARASARHREIAVRLAMGADRSRIIRQLLTETLLLSGIGGAAGLLFARWSTRLLLAFFVSRREGPGVSQNAAFDLHADWRVVLFTLAAIALSGILVGLAPAVRATRVGISAALKERVHNVHGEREGRIGIGRFILALQAALSILLVAGAGLFAGSLFHLLMLNPGFNPKNVVLAAIDTGKHPEKGAALANLYARLLDRMNSLPGVRAASLIWFTPLSNGGWDDYLGIPGRTGLSNDQRDTYINLIGPRFFEVMDSPLLAGREFNTLDTAASEKVGILNEFAARRFFPNQNPIGVHVLLENNAIRIVGLARNAKYLNLREPVPPTLYLPYPQNTGAIPSLTFLLKTDSSVSGVYPAFRAALHGIAPDVPIGVVKSMQEQVDESLGSERLMASLSIFFGLLALLLTSIGLYGILAYAVSRRTGEIGLRMALGARRHDVIWLILRETMGDIALGIAAGIVAVLATSRLIASFLYGMRPNDPGNLVLALCVLALVAAIAAWVPARRATRLDPMLALREE